MPLSYLLSMPVMYFLNVFLVCLFACFFATLFINWRILALQDFVVFCQTSTRSNHRDTHAPSLGNFPPHPSLLDCHRAPVWVPWGIQQIPIGCLFSKRSCLFPCSSLHTSHPLPPLLTLDFSLVRCFSVVFIFPHCFLQSSYCNFCYAYIEVV